MFDIKKISKKNILVILTLIIILIILFCIYNFLLNPLNKIKLYIDKDINQQVYNIKTKKVIDLDHQNLIEKKIDSIKRKKEYTFSNPLLIINPYGTNTTGLYIYFETEKKVAVEYTIIVDDESIPDYSNMLVGDLTKIHEGQIIGLIQGKKNTLVLKMLDENLDIISEKTIILNLPIYNKNTIDKIDIKEINTIDEISEGLYFPSGIKNNENSTLGLPLYDNNGILRAEFYGEGGSKGQTIQFTDNGDLLYLNNSTKKDLIRVNKNGKVIDIYEDLKYSHEFMYKDNYLYYVSAQTDIIYQYDLDKHKNIELFDFKDIFSELYEESMNYYYSIYPENKGKRINGHNWLHCNSIDFINDNDVIVSCREWSSIFYIENLFNKPTLKYIISDSNIWKNTKYEEYLLKQEGNFTPQYGQHTVRVELSNELNDGQYYLYMFNNNFAGTNVIDNSDWINKVNKTVGKKIEDDVNSKIYKYLVDENNSTYKLVLNSNCDYSYTRGGVYVNDDNYIVGSSGSLIYSEYNSQGEKIISYSLEGITTNLIRCEKYNFKNIWFGTLKKYINYGNEKQENQNNNRIKISNGGLYKYNPTSQILLGLNIDESIDFMYYDTMYFDIYEYTKEEITIPSEIDGIKIKKISGFNISNLKVVKIEEGIEEIADYCFLGAENLEKVYIPKTVKKIGEKAFGLKNVEIIEY